MKETTCTFTREDFQRDLTWLKDGLDKTAPNDSLSRVSVIKQVRVPAERIHGAGLEEFAPCVESLLAREPRNR